MGEHPELKFARQAVLGLAALTTLYFSASTFDPFNLPKLVVLIATAALALVLIASSAVVRASIPMWGVGAVGIFIAVMSLNAAIGEAPIARALWGTTSRNTGLLAYIGLALVAVLAMAVFRITNARKLARFAVVITGVSAFYGLVQHLGLDPIAWNNPYNPIISTLGNPNFAAAFLGINGVIALALVLDPRELQVWRWVSGAVLAVSLFLTLQSDALQGIAVFLLGGSFVVGAWIARTGPLKRLYWPFVGVTAISGVIGVAGAIGKGPLGPLLFQDSVTYRGDYWLAGIKMMQQNPVLGVGLDSYIDEYRAVRTVEAALRRGPQIVTDSAHNVLIQFGATGGYPLLLAYLVVIGGVIAATITFVKKANSHSNLLIAVGLFGAWLAFLTQSIVSIDQLGLAVWGWLLAGAVIGIGFGKEQPVWKSKVDPIPVKQGAAIAAALATLLVTWPYMTLDKQMRDVQWISVQNQEKAKTVPFPTLSDKYLDNARYVSTVALARSVLGQNEELTNALEEGLRRNPRDFVLQLTATEVMSQIGPFDKAVTYGRQAVANDPYNQTAWLALGKALLANGQQAEAIDVLTQGIAIEPDAELAAPLKTALSELQQQ